jgi:fumarate hydratase subunit beta
VASYELTVPIAERQIRALRVGDSVRLSGTIVTGRDAAHKYMTESFVAASEIPQAEIFLYHELQRLLAGGVIYHCGPVVREIDGGWEFVAAGPTTSIREEIYEPGVIARFGLRGVIGKGGMGRGTLDACGKHGAVYFHAVGGAATLIASSVKKVLAVHKKAEFGVPEALWVIQVEGFPVVVTMDSHGNSMHDCVEAASKEALGRLA